MPFERRAFAAVTTLFALAAATACRDATTPPAEALPERFAGVRRQAGSPATAQSAFCEKTYPAGGAGARPYTPPPLRPLPGPEMETTGTPPGATRTTWTWVNLWATWCAPCVEEMELLGRWRDGFARDGMPIGLELISIDAPDRGRELATWRSKGLPGSVRWLRAEQDLGPLLDALGVDRGAMIPIHALVDPSGRLRCVRVGAVHEQDYAAVKGLLARR